MSETRWTAGPWEEYGIAIEAGRVTVCLMGEPAQYAGDTADMCVNHEANAHLIAAAPDLYGALWNMVSLAKPYMRDEAQMIGMAEARAALAKARGEEQPR